MGTDLIPHSEGSVTYYSPSNSSSPTVVREVIVIREKSESDASGIGKFLAGVGTALSGFAAIITLANSNNNPAPTTQQYKQQYSPPTQQHSQPVQRYEAPRYYTPPPRCWYEQQPEYVGRFFTHREEWPVYDQYGRFRGVRWRDHYVDRYRDVSVRRCSY